MRIQSNTWFLFFFSHYLSSVWSIVGPDRRRITGEAKLMDRLAPLCALGGIATAIDTLPDESSQKRGKEKKNLKKKRSCDDRGRSVFLARIKKIQNTFYFLFFSAANNYGKNQKKKNVPPSE